MHFEDILKEVGGYGPYQKMLIFTFLVPAYTVIPWFTMNMIFMSSTPDHWCYVSDVANSNLSMNLQSHLVRPPHEPLCSTYDVNYSRIMESGNWTVDNKWPTRPCRDGWQYDTSKYASTIVTKWNLVCKDSHYSSLVLSVQFMGNIFGMLVYGFMSDRLGRKPTFLFLAGLVAVTEFGSILSPSFVLLLVLRFFNGSAMISIFGVGYIIILELVNPEFRARVNMLASTCYTLGLCYLPLVAWLTADWIWMSTVTAVCAAALLFYWKLLPESPRWLISQKRYEAAAEIMSKISKRNGKAIHEGNQLLEKIQELGEKTEKDGEKSSHLDFFKYPTLRKRFLLITICWIGTSVPYYGLQMNVRNLAGSEFLNFFLVSLVEVPAHFAVWYSMDRFGRRWSSVCAFAVITVSCATPVVFPTGYSTVGVVASLFGKIGSSAAFMAMFQQAPELYPTSHRNIGMGMSSTIGSGSSLLGPYIVYLAKFGSFIPFLIFSLVALVACICASFLPETLNKRLPQTINDAENFELDFKFCPCTGKSKSEPTSEELRSI